MFNHRFKPLAFLLGILLVTTFSVIAKPALQPLKLWYTKPAIQWEEALPIGNGRLGGMVFGGIQEDHVQFNEETLWSGEPHDYAHPGAYQWLDKIRELLWQGKQEEAEALALKQFMSIPLTQKRYMAFGDLWIRFGAFPAVTDYHRELDLRTALCRTTFRSGGTLFTREYFSSFPDQALVVHLAADHKRALTFKATLSALHEGYTVESDREGALVLNVKVKDGVLKGTARIKINAPGGKVHVEGDQLSVEGANEATLYLTAATSFINPHDVSGDPQSKSLAALNAVENKKYEEIKRHHIQDYQTYFNRFEIDLGKSLGGDRPTDERIKGVLNQMDNELAALYVQYGRYLLLSSSRPGTYPATLQGIWNDKLNPPWDSKYTVNINIEMNYWAVEALNLSECHDALFKMLEEVVPAGERVAQEHYRAHGWVLHHNTDLWRGAAPINHSNHGIWVGGSGWFAHHFWEHFLYTRDTTFLRERGWPIIKGAARFYADFLVPDPKRGFLVSCPSNSPETGGLVSGPTMDHEIIKSLFKICIEASDLLKTDKPFADSLRSILPRMAPYQIGRFGQLQEWVEDIDDPLDHHRHVSHLWGVFPGKEINWQTTPDLMKAAQTSLVARGDEGTGWSLAWKINFWARFRDGDHAWNMMRMLLRPTGQTGTKMVGGGAYPNLFDAHPPFQIDGNFGGASGIVEMLVQSHLDAIDILPALPEGIPTGSVRGVMARGGFNLEIEWKEHRLSRLVIHSGVGSPLFIRYQGKTYQCATHKGENITFDGNLNRLRKL